jgi:hypothetical protein
MILQVHMITDATGLSQDWAHVKKPYMQAASEDLAPQRLRNGPGYQIRRHSTTEAQACGSR